MIASPLGPLNVLAVPLVLAALAQGLSAENRATLLRAAQATLLLAIYRLAYTSIPLVWYAADALGWAMGSVAARCTGQPLWVGATMGGVDYLVPMLYLVPSAHAFRKAPLSFPERDGGEGKLLPSPAGRGAGGEGKLLPSPAGRGAGGEGVLDGL